MLFDGDERGLDDELRPQFEAIEEKKDVFHELIVEAIEDICLIKTPSGRDRVQRRSTNKRFSTYWKVRREHRI